MSDFFSYADTDENESILFAIFAGMEHTIGQLELDRYHADKRAEAMYEASTYLLAGSTVAPRLAKQAREESREAFIVWEDACAHYARIRARYPMMHTEWLARKHTWLAAREAVLWLRYWPLGRATRRFARARKPRATKPLTGPSGRP